MDMWPGYIRATNDAIPNADEKNAFDNYHIAKYLDDGPSLGDQGVRYWLVALQQLHLSDQSLEALVKLDDKMPIGSGEKGGSNHQKHLWAIIKAIVMNIDNSGAESINSLIKMIKIRSCVFQSKFDSAKQCTSISADSTSIRPGSRNHVYPPDREKIKK